MDVKVFGKVLLTVDRVVFAQWGAGGGAHLRFLFIQYTPEFR